MIKHITIATAFAFASPTIAQDKHGDHAMQHDHGDEHHDHQHDDQKESVEKSSKDKLAALTRTKEIDAALAEGGEPVVIDILGVVCDFCAKAMNKTFGKQDEVAATYVDLDTKALSLVLKPGATLADETITKLVKKAGYKAAAIRRGDLALYGETDAVDPS